MTAHSDGQGSSWNETLDVDQPHGLDYREWNDVRIGTRKRMEQEHATFADNTVGGIHTPGGAAILGIEDGTATIVADGTLKGHGIAWDNSSRLYCSTAVAGASTTGDWTLVKLHPDKQWGGQDVTWTGSHEFDGSVDISGNLAVDGDLTVDGNLITDGNLAVGIKITASGDLAVLGDMSVDGTTDFGGAVGFTGDVTLNGLVDGTQMMYNPSETGYQIADVSGTLNQTVKVYTKYITGTTDNDASTDIAHGITGIDNILSVSATIFSNVTNIYTVSDYLETASGSDNDWSVGFDGTNVTLIHNTAVQGQKFRIKIDYIL